MASTGVNGLPPRSIGAGVARLRYCQYLAISCLKLGLTPDFFRTKSFIAFFIFNWFEIVASSGRKMASIHTGQEPLQFALQDRDAAMNGVRQSRSDAELVSEK
jgi:hypothetical protein